MTKETLGSRLKRRRLAAGLGLRETASKAGISATYLSRIENGQETSPPAEKVLSELARLLDEDVDELLQLAGRVPEDVQQLFRSDPKLAAFLRTAKKQRLSGNQLLELLDGGNRSKRPKGGR